MKNYTIALHAFNSKKGLKLLPEKQQNHLRKNTSMITFLLVVLNSIVISFIISGPASDTTSLPIKVTLIILVLVLDSLLVLLAAFILSKTMPTDK
jgi:preprotein translocase subunit SecY